MAVTLVSAVMVMAAYFLLLYAVVGLFRTRNFSLPRLKKIWLLFQIKKRGFAALISLAG